MRVLRFGSALLILTLGGLSSLPAPAQPDRLRRQFEAANEAYAQDRYAEAVSGYRALLEAGYASGALYHNLGNAYVRLDSTGAAVWAYERGLQLRPEDPRLRHNLKFVRRRAGLSPIGLPPRGLAALVAGWSPLFLFVGGMMLLSVGGGAAVFLAEEDWGGAWRTPVTWGLVVAGGLLVGAALGTSYVQAHERRAVVMTKAVPLRAAPAETASPDSTLKAGTTVDVQEPRATWWRVRLGDGTAGWIPARALRDV